MAAAIAAIWIIDENRALSISLVPLGSYHVIGFGGGRYDSYVRRLWDGKGAFSVEAMAAEPWPRYAVDTGRVEAQTGV